MTNSTIKKYSFYDFDLKFENCCFKKNELSVYEANNVDITKNCIEPLNAFENYLEINFSKNKIELLKASDLELFNNIKIIYPYSYLDKNNSLTKTRYFVLDVHNNLFEIDFEENKFINLNIIFDSKPNFFINNLKLYIFSTKDKFVYFDCDSNAIFMTDYCEVKTFAKYQDNLFFATTNDRFSIYYSEETEIENLSSNLSIYNSYKLSSENGEVLEIKVFNNNIYVIQQFAIIRFTFNNGKFNIVSLFPVASKIKANSVQQLDDYIAFLTSSGLYVFDGANLKNVFTNNQFCLKANEFISVAFNEKYYLLVKDKNNSNLIEFNILNGKLNNYYYENITDLYVIKSFNEYKLLISILKDKREVLQLTDNNNKAVKKRIKFNRLLFDDYFSKMISEISIYSKGNYSLKISSEHESKTINVNENLRLRNLGIIGDYFEFEIFSNDYFKIESIIISLTYFSEKLWLIVYLHLPNKMKNCDKRLNC